MIKKRFKNDFFQYLFLGNWFYERISKRFQLTRFSIFVLMSQEANTLLSKVKSESSSFWSKDLNKDDQKQ